MSSRQRRQFTGQQKVEIVKRHLLDEVAVSELCEEFSIQPTQFYTWQKQLFENGEKAFERKSKSPKASASLEKKQIATLAAAFELNPMETFRKRGERELVRAGVAWRWKP